MANTNPARGMRDFLPAEVRRREYVIKIIKAVYESYGFEPLETPAVENLETLTGKYGEEGNQLIFKILKRGEKLNAGDAELSDLALRYDLTVPLARVVANRRNELPKFFKRYQIQPVWRADRPARGRFREFYQCDVDAIGSKSMIVEAELCAAVSEILQKLGFDDFAIRINHRNILSGMMELSVIEKEKRDNVLVIIDKLDKIGVDGVRKELSEFGISESSIKTIIHNITNKFIITQSNEIQDFDSSMDKFAANNGRLNFTAKSFVNVFSENESLKFGREAVNEIREINYLSRDFSSTNHLVYDPSLARGLSYYTGAIFEINVPDLAGSLGGGGRYDGLIGMFGKEAIPACGFSLGLERILVVMEERGMFQKLIDEGKLKADSADVLITIWDKGNADENVANSLSLANDLRRQNLRVLVYPEADKLGKQFKYAAQIGAPFVCVLGEDEIKNNTVALKNMQTGEQEAVARKNVAEKIKQ